MALYPRAQRLLLPESRTQAIIKARQLILHSMAAPWTVQRLYEYWRDSTNLESHFGIDYSGTVAQYVDTGRRADANAYANGFALSVETSSAIDSSDPWNAAQVDALADLMVWVHRTHDVPLRRAPAWDEPGMGYHRMYPQWSLGGTECPGDRRTEQFREVLALATQRAEEGADTVVVPPPSHAKPKPESKTVIVWAGATLTAIALMVGTSVYAIQKANPEIKDPDKITPGQTLLIPAPKTVCPPCAKAKPPAYKPPAYPRGLRPGSASPSARNLQKTLKDAGYMSKSIPFSTFYGPQTQASVKRFHKANPAYGRAGDPAIGPKGWAHLHLEAYAGAR